LTRQDSVDALAKSMTGETSKACRVTFMSTEDLEEFLSDSKLETFKLSSAADREKFRSRVGYIELDVGLPYDAVYASKTCAVASSQGALDELVERGLVHAYSSIVDAQSGDDPWRSKHGAFSDFILGGFVVGGKVDTSEKQKKTVLDVVVPNWQSTRSGLLADAITASESGATLPVALVKFGPDHNGTTELQRERCCFGATVRRPSHPGSLQIEIPAGLEKPPECKSPEDCFVGWSVIPRPVRETGQVGCVDGDP
jgi:hypothetical protein